MNAPTDAPAEVYGPPAPEAAEPATSGAPAEAQAPAESPTEFTGTHVVTRRFYGNGIDRVSGEVVDASNWRAADRLVGNRFLRVLTREDPNEFVTDDVAGRHFIDDDSFLAFIEATEQENAE
jgi:hypothetical protein